MKTFRSLESNSLLILGFIMMRASISLQRSLVTAACGQLIINIGQLTDSREQRDVLTGKTLMIALAIVFLMALA
jgi:hypothetical protein